MEVQAGGGEAGPRPVPEGTVPCSLARPRTATETTVELGEIANAEAQAFGKPLDGVRVLAIEQMQALPYATQMLRRFGAEVVKVEPPGKGESARQALPMMRDPEGNAVGNTYLRNNLGKRTIGVNLKHPAGRDLDPAPRPAIRRRGPELQVGARWNGSGSATTTSRAVHPSVIYVSVSGFGTTCRPSTTAGPRTRRSPRRWRASTRTRAPRRRRRSSRRWARSATPAPRSSPSSACSRRCATATARVRASTSTSPCSTRWSRWPTPA